MIKCIGYLKSLKQYLFILLISCFIFGVSSFASSFNLYENMYVRQNGDYGFSPYNFDYNVNVVARGNLLTEQIGYTLKGLYFRDGTYFVWKYSDYLGGIGPFLSVQLSGLNQSYYQGFPTHYALCNEFDGNNHIEDLTLSGCNIYPLNSGSIGLIGNFMSGVSLDDTFGFNYKYSSSSYNPDIDNAGLIVCFSSSSYHRSMCFGIGRYIYGPMEIYPGFGPDQYNPNYYSGYGVSLPISYSNLFNSDLDYSPGGYSSNIPNGPDENNFISGLTGDYSYSTCTNGEILAMLGNLGYNKYLCYGGLDNFDLWSSSNSYSPVPGTGKRLSQILSYSNAWDSPQEWFEYWNGLYQDKDNPLYYTMWESYPAVYRTWFDMYYKYNGPGKYFDNIREYCVMSVDLSLNPDTVYNGSQFDYICDAIIDIKQNPNSTYNQSGVAVGVNWQGVGNLSGDNKNAVQFIQGFFDGVKNSINTDYDGPGFLPGYIILFLMALIFFRFISH